MWSRSLSSCLRASVALMVVIADLLIRTGKRTSMGVRSQVRRVVANAQRITRERSEPARSACSVCAASQVLRTEPAVLGDPRQHPWADLIAIVKGEDEVGPAGTGKDAMRAGLALDRPANPKKGRENELGSGARPVAHAAAKEMFRNSRPASWFSRRSATTRNASACTRAMASSWLAP